MGVNLARLLAKLGHHVSIANARGPESLAALAAEIGVAPVSVADAVKGADIVILAIPTKAVANLPRELFAETPESTVVIDIGNYHPDLRDGRIGAIEQGLLDSQWVARQIARPVVKAFNNILARACLRKAVPKAHKDGSLSLSPAMTRTPRESCFTSSTSLASIPSMLAPSPAPGASKLERPPIAATSKP